MTQERIARASARRYLAVGLMLMVAGCGETRPVRDSSDAEELGRPPTRFAVLSDLHYYDPALGIAGPAFEAATARDRKMIAQSDAILTAASESLRRESLKLVLVAGDLTKDGVKHNHEVVATYLAGLKASGKHVYVVPGNHDISNPGAYSYPASSAPILEQSITADQFRRLYGAFGFDEALELDPHSLSYVAQPEEGLWILAIDTCNYDNRFSDISAVGGSISDQTMDWIAAQLAAAKRRGITVLGLMHHGVVEHFPGMATVFGEYLVHEWQQTAGALAGLGLNIVFTGHHHANDISRTDTGAGPLIDIQTGSTVSWPSPFRLGTYDADTQSLTLTSRRITEIEYDLGDKTFVDFSYEFLETGLHRLISPTLVAYSIPQSARDALASLIVQTFMAYFAGDEARLDRGDVVEALAGVTSDMGSAAPMLAELMLSIWADDTPDNDVTIDLQAATIVSAFWSL